MNSTLKTSMIAATVAVTASLASMFAFTRLGGSDKSVENSSFLTYSNKGGLYNASMSAPGEPANFVEAAESTVNGVVSIKSYITPKTQNIPQGYADPFLEFFFGPQFRQQPRQQHPEKKGNEENKFRQSGLGSGVIITSDGYIVTNNHVIENADKLDVTLNDNRNFTAKVIGTDPTTDLALIKIDAENLHVIPFGASEDLHVGEWVLAVGNPFGFTSTVTKGIVSAKGRNISSSMQTGSRGIESFIQTDAAVNPGNSGGALVNLNGELVGINTAIYSQTGNFAGYSFAIPTSIVRKVITDLKEYGAVQRALLGISFVELSPELAKEKNIKGINSGIYVADVTEHSAALEAGLKEGDIIVSIDNKIATSTGIFQEEIAKHRPGDKITLGFYRDGKPQTVSIVLRNARGDTSTIKAANSSIESLGCKFEVPSEDELRSRGLRSGLRVTDIKEGLFKKAGIRDGFIILDINNMRMTNKEDIEEIYKEILKSGPEYDKVMFITGIYPNGRKAYYAVPLEE